jgi:light-regulated signal transduction histidine kinase (bacteriophytochrome)
VLESKSGACLEVRIASENTDAILQYSPSSLFGLVNFLDAFPVIYRSEFEAWARQIIKASTPSEPTIFSTAIRTPQGIVLPLSCAMHCVTGGKNLIICEFEAEDFGLSPSLDMFLPDEPVNTVEADIQPDLTSNNSTESFLNSPYSPFAARRREGMELITVIAHIQTRLSAAKTFEELADAIVCVVQDLTKFHRVMVYQFDDQFNGAVIAEIIHPRASVDLYKGLRFPAGDIPAQARRLYQINKVRLLFDREQETSRLVCRSVEDLEPALDLTHSYLRAISKIHLKYLANMGVRSTMSVSLELKGKLWGLICCHSYGPTATNISFQMREVCHWIGLCASDCLEKLSSDMRLESRSVLETIHASKDPQSCITASASDILKLFDARSGFVVVQGEARSLGRHKAYQEAIILLRYLNTQHFDSIMACSNLSTEYPDVLSIGSLKSIAGFLIIPLSDGNKDFVLLMRDHQAREVNWAGRPKTYDPLQPSSDRLEPRQSFKMWTEHVTGFSKDWTDEQTHDL